MTNCSGCISKESEDFVVKNFTIYAVEGILLALSNAIIFAAILRQPLIRTRKQYVILAGVSLINSWHGVAGIVGGVGRILLINAGNANVQLTRWQCFKTPWILLWQVSDPLTTLMLMIVSIDRLLAIADPLFYFGLTWKYALGLVAGAYSYVFVSVLFAAYRTSFHAEAIYSSICMIVYSTDPVYYEVMVASRIFFVSMSIVLYVVVFVLFKRANHKIAGCLANKQLELEKKKQRQVTKSFGISCLITFVLYLVPLMGEMVAVLLEIPKSLHTTVSIVRHILNNCDSLLDFLVFSLSQKDFRLAIKYLFRCKTITQTILDKEEKLQSVKQASSIKKNELQVKKHGNDMEIQSV